jgi:Family of unknown function (DUF6067)
MARALVLAALLVCCTSRCARAPAPVHLDTLAHEPAIAVRLTQHPPTVDGAVHEDEWSEATVVDGFSDLQGARERRPARAYVAADEQNLYLAIISALPEQGALQSEVDRPTLELVHDDSVEFWLDAEPERARHAVYQLIANALGTTASQGTGYGMTVQPSWEKSWQLASGMHDGHWQVELRVPISSVAPGRRTTEGEWRINLCRNWKRPWTFTSMFGGDYARGKRFRVERDVPVVHQLHRKDPFPGWVDSLIDIYNPGRSPMLVDVTQSLRPDAMPDISEHKQVEVAPGATVRVALEKLDQHSQHFELNQEVKVGTRVLFSRKTEWERGPQEFHWRIAQNPEPPLKFDFAFYPSTGKLRVLLDASRVLGSSAPRAVEVSLRGQDGRFLFTSQVALDARQQGVLVKSLPGLRGRYKLTAQLRDQRGELQRAEHEFERKSIPGEGDKLGTSRTVFAPFEPLSFSRGKLTATLREHQVGPGLIWRQVTAQASETGIRKDLFAAPMRVLAKIDGRDVEVEGDSVDLTQEDPDRVVLESKLQAGPLEIDVKATTELDGMTWFNWTLRPTAARVDSLVLEVPLRAEQAPFIHAMSDGIRNTIVHEALPAGDGTVWSAATLKPYRVPANWASYVYLGSGVRGLAWFAENDRDWGWDERTPNVEVVRRKGVVTLRVSLINTPGSITGKRSLQFGLQAAPLKRRIANWRYLWSKDSYALLGTDLNWLAGSNCGSLYPVDGDLSFWDALAEANRAGLSADTIDRLVSRGEHWFRSHEGAASLADWKRHVEANLGPTRRGMKMVYYYNRASSPAYDEFQTFQDEWTLADHRNTSLTPKLAGEIKIVPSHSYNNVALHWYERSFARGGNRGVYWDNWFIMGSFNTELTDAYLRSDGRIRPAAGMLGLRELARRTFQWLGERGVSPVITMPHMTSTNILPMMGFATFQLDWEAHYGEGPVQRRFSPEYLQLMSTGELTGTVPVTLLGPGNVDVPILRSDAAVRLVHELDVLVSAGRGVPSITDAVNRIVREPALQSYRYWDERRQPARSADPNVRAIDYVLPRARTLVGLASWHDHPVDVRVDIDWVQLGLDPRKSKVRDVETGKSLEVRDGRVEVRLLAFDLALLELTPR